MKFRSTNLENATMKNPSTYSDLLIMKYSSFNHLKTNGVNKKILLRNLIVVSKKLFPNTL